MTRVGALPLLPEVAHEWPTLLTVIIQANQLRYLAVGDAHPTVISFDMALSEKMVQLLDASPDLKRTTRHHGCSASSWRLHSELGYR